MSKLSLKAAGGASGSSTTDKAQKIGFMEKLVKILNESDERIVSWSSSGTSFLVHDVKRFSEEVLQQYLRTTNFASFIRQLNYYGFHKVTHPAQNHVPLYEFRHEKFQRDNMDGVTDIRRRNGATDGVSLAEHEALRTSHDDLRCRLDSSERMVVTLRSERDTLAAQLADTATQLSNALAALNLAQTQVMEAREATAQAQAQAAAVQAQASSGGSGGSGRKRQRQGALPASLLTPTSVAVPLGHQPSTAAPMGAPAPLLPVPVPVTCSRRDSLGGPVDDCWGLGEVDGADPLQWGDFSLNPTACPVSPFAATAGGAAGGLGAGQGTRGDRGEDADAMDDAESALLPLRVSVPLPLGCDLEALRPFGSLALDDGGVATHSDSNPGHGSGGLAAGAAAKGAPGGGGLSGSPSMLSLAGSDLADLDEVDLGGTAALLDWGSWMDQSGSPLTPLTPLPSSPVTSGTSAVDCSGSSGVTGGALAPTPAPAGAGAAVAAADRGSRGGASSASTAASQVPDERLQRRMQDMRPEERALLLAKIVAAMIARTVVVASGYPESAEAAQVAAASAAVGCSTPLLGAPVVPPALPSSSSSPPSTSPATGTPGGWAPSTLPASSSSTAGFPAVVGSVVQPTTVGGGAPAPPSPATLSRTLHASLCGPQGPGTRSASPARAGPGGVAGSPTPASSPLRMRTGGVGAGVGGATSGSADLLLESQFPPEVLLAYMLPARDVQLMYDARMGGGAARMVTVN